MKDVVYRVGYALDTVCCPIQLAYALNPQPATYNQPKLLKLILASLLDSSQSNVPEQLPILEVCIHSSKKRKKFIVSTRSDRLDLLVHHD